MASFNSFKDIHAWQNARVLTQQVHGICKELDTRREWGLRDQLFRASLSVMNNIAEGFGRFSNADFLRFLSISRSSGYEVGSMLVVVRDLQLASSETVAATESQLDKTLAPIAGLMSYLQTEDAKNRSRRGKQ